ALFSNKNRSTMKAILFDEIGSPSEVLYLDEIEQPQIEDDELLIRMVGASINPGDFLFIQNLYPEPKRPKFPRQVSGNHGAGIVVKGGKNTTIKPGAFVAFYYYDTWTEYVAVPEEWLIELPANYPVEKASQLLNIVTAWDLLAVSNVKPGEWLAVTAGNSAVSLMLTQFARKKGIQVISVVRQRRKEFDKIGASATIDLSELKGTVKEKVKEITGGKGIAGIVDNMGGPVLTDLVRSAVFNSKVIINGGMSPDNFELHNFDILLKGLEIKSYVYRYFFTPPLPGDKKELNEIIALSNEADFYVPVGGLYELDRFEEAIRNSIDHPSVGKNIFIFNKGQ
ncbi:MAG: zinc-binding dehydrogenase, partial [Bacteroidota bacterium]